jgi:hypothetical protein
MNCSILLCALAALQIPSQVTFGKKKDDKDYVVPKQIIRDAAENVLKFLIVEDGVVPNTHSDASGGPAGNPLKFGDVFRILDTDQDSKAFFICNVVNAKPVPIGWVTDDALLIIRDDGAAKCMRNTKTLIQRKALLIYNGDEKDLKGSEGLSKLTATLGTGAQAAKGQSVNFYNILYVFKEKKNDKDEVIQLLLGFEPEVLPDKVGNIQESLIGWFDAKYAYRWETREALEYDVASTRPNAPAPGRRTKPTPIFETAEDAELASSTKSTEGLKLVPLKESFGEDGVSIPFTRNQSRYPIINIDQRRAKHPTQGNMYQIGVIGDFVSFGPDGKPIDRISAADLQEQRNRLAEIKRQFDSTEILLVIDDTGSMSDYYKKYIPNWVEELVGNIAGGKELRNQDVYVTVCFYHDLDDKVRNNFQGTPDEARALLAKAVHVISRKQIASTNKNNNLASELKELVTSMKDHKSPAGGDPLEQMLYGLEHGLDEANKNVLPHARKLCILIGDTGSHTVNINGFSQKEQIPNIAKNLVPEGDSSPWELVAIQVPAMGNALQADFKLFRDQIGDIENEVKKESVARNKQNKDRLEKDKIQFSGLLAGSVNLFEAPEDPKEVLDSLKKAINIRDKIFEDFSKKTTSIARGARTPSGGSTIDRELRERLKAAGIDVDRLTQSGAQLFYKGYVWEFDADEKRQVRIKLLMSDLEMNKTEEVISQFMQNAKRAGQNADLNQSVANSMIQLVSGDKKLAEKVKIGDVGFAEAIAKQQGIHLESFLFKKALNQLGAMTFNETLQELNKIQYKLWLLQDLQNKQLREFVKEKDEDAKAGDVPETVYKWRVKAGSTSTPATRFFKFQATDSKTLSYIWLDLEDEFP